ncbi:cytochrome P450 76AD1-like protein [Tanacetum coccineum]
MEDPRLITLPCRLGNSKPFDTLADLGSCVNIIPLYLFKKLNIGLLEETDHIFGLADETKSYPVGNKKDVEVNIGKLKLLNDFYVIDMKKDPETPLLVGRGFLATANAVIDYKMATTDKESSAARTDNRPPMLEESDFVSWKIHIKREKTDEEFIEAENNKEHTDIQATNILSQGLPRHIFNTLNQTETAKEIWKNVELLMQRSGLTEQQKKETLFDQYESKDISTVSYVDLYTHLKSYEQHAMKTLSKMNQTSGNADPLAYRLRQSTLNALHFTIFPPPPQNEPCSTTSSLSNQ